MTAATTAGDRPLRRAHLIAALSLAVDLGLRQPPDWTLRCCVASAELGGAVGLGDDDRRALFYVSLLRHIGCTATASEEAALFGSEFLAPEALIADARDARQALRFILAVPGRDARASRRLRFVGSALAAGPKAKDRLERVQCEAACRLAADLGLAGGVVDLLGQVFERWDGWGVPAGLAGDEIELCVRLAQVGHDAVTLDLWRGRDAVVPGLRARAGKILDPELVVAFCDDAGNLLSAADDALWDRALACEPRPVDVIGDVDAALAAIADFGDLKSPFLLGHSRRVAELAAGAGAVLRLPDSETADLRRAGLVHDVGRVGVSAAIWDKPGRLTDAELERVRLHPYYSERVVSRAPPFAQLGRVASRHHERLDGSGYHRGLNGGSLELGARVLAAADAYSAMVEPRPHRPPLSATRAAGELRAACRRGALDGDAVEAVLAAAGHAIAAGGARRGLSPRELEVVRLAARGLTIKAMAGRLQISPKTVDRHLQNVYAKIGVSTRAGVALHAMRHGLLPPSPDL